MTDDGRFGAFSLEELSDYLDSDRTPARPEIDVDPEAARALDRLRTLRSASRELLDADAGARAAESDDGWIAGVLASIRTTAHAGRDIPVPDPDPTSTLVVTEGALRGLVRALGDGVPGLVVRRTTFSGDLAVPGAPVDVEVSVVAAADGPVHLRAAALRTTLESAFTDHAPFTLRSLVVRVTDLIDGDSP